MKAIIACTDFSPNANNALQYAAALAEAAGARLILFHYFNMPVAATDLPGLNPSAFLDAKTAECEGKLEGIKTGLKQTYEIDITCIVRSFDLFIDVETTFRHQQADLVVMGMHGQNAVLNALMGNIPSTAIRRGKTPMLLIPSGVVFKPVKKILFACDNHEIPNTDTMWALQDMATTLDAYIEVLTLFDEDKSIAFAPKDVEVRRKSNLETLLAPTRHGYSFENETMVKEGILYEALRSSADVVAMIPHHHSFLSSLFNQSETQRIAASITLPLLVLGEKVQLTAYDEADTVS